MNTGFFLLLLLFEVLAIAASSSFPSTSDPIAVQGSIHVAILFAPGDEHLVVVRRNGQVQKRSLPHLSPAARVDPKEPLHGAALFHDDCFLTLGAPRGKRLLMFDTTDLHLVNQSPTHPTTEGTVRVAHKGEEKC